MAEQGVLRLYVNPDKLGGQPTIGPRRVTLACCLALLKEGHTASDLVDLYDLAPGEALVLQRVFEAAQGIFEIEVWRSDDASIEFQHADAIGGTQEAE